jgi:hypothetical protein
MAGNTTVDVMSQRVLSIAMIINGAPLVRDEEKQAETEHHRGNTAWHISFPSQGITFMVTNESGDPQTGYYNDKQAESDCLALWDQIRNATEKQRADMVANSEFPELRDGFKIMTRTIRVQPIG